MIKLKKKKIENFWLIMNNNKKRPTKKTPNKNKRNPKKLESADQHYIVLFDFTPEKKIGYLEIKKGDQIQLVEKKETGWWRYQKFSFKKKNLYKPN